MHRSRLSLALATLACAWCVPSSGYAQADDTEPRTPDQLVDFILRPTQEAGEAEEEQDIWNWDTEPEPSAIDEPIGTPLAGPTEGEAIGPPLAGPTPEPIERGRLRTRRTTIGEPFDPLGIRLGSFIIRPSIEAGVTATDNAGGTTDKVAAVGAILAPEIRVTSEGEGHLFEAHARNETISYDRSEFNEDTADARARLRYDLTSATSLEAEVGYARFLEDFNDPDTPAAASTRPAVNEFDAILGVEQRFGALSARLTGIANRELHDDVTLEDGGTASLADLNNTEIGSRLRVGYATSAILRPFAEVAVGARAFDEARDDNGFARSSVWGELRGGLVVARGEKLSGEASLGYRREDFEDERLEDLNVPLANAAILWSPRRLTEVRLDLSTEVDPTTAEGASATILYSGTLTLEHRFTTRVSGEVGIGLDHDHDVGGDFRELTFTGFAGASYHFNRIASVVARYEYDRSARTAPDEEFDVHEVSVRLRLER